MFGHDDKDYYILCVIITKLERGKIAIIAFEMELLMILVKSCNYPLYSTILFPQCVIYS